MRTDLSSRRRTRKQGSNRSWWNNEAVFGAVLTSLVSLAGMDAVQKHPVTMILVIMAAMMCFSTSLALKRYPRMVPNRKRILNNISMFCGTVTLPLLCSIILFPHMGWVSYALCLVVVILVPAKLIVNCLTKLAQVFLQILVIIAIPINFIIRFIQSKLYPPPPQAAVGGASVDLPV